jgi:hypothetical protein
MPNVEVYRKHFETFLYENIYYTLTCKVIVTFIVLVVKLSPNRGHVVSADLKHETGFKKIDQLLMLG